MTRRGHVEMRLFEGAGKAPSRGASHRPRHRSPGSPGLAAPPGHPPPRLGAPGAARHSPAPPAPPDETAAPEAAVLHSRALPFRPKHTYAPPKSREFSRNGGTSAPIGAQKGTF